MKFAHVFLACAVGLTLAHTATAATKDDLCMARGKYAMSVLEGKKIGITEDELIKGLVANKVSARTERAAKRIIGYVYMVPSYDNLRYMVYVKCLAGEYD